VAAATRESNGRALYYIEGWYAISGANRIFGFPLTPRVPSFARIDFRDFREENQGEPSQRKKEHRSENDRWKAAFKTKCARLMWGTDATQIPTVLDGKVWL